MNVQPTDTSIDLARHMGGKRFHTILADPPWRFINRTGKVATEHHLCCDTLNPIAKNACESSVD